MPFIFLLAMCLLVAAWVWGDRKRWKKYQSTMLYVSLMDFTYYYYTNHTELWLFHPVNGHHINETIHNFVINPLIAFIFLSNYPKRAKLKQFLYTLAFIVFFCSVEGLEHLLGYISYTNGWNYGWSVLLFALMFPMFRLHHTKPVCAYVLSIGCTVFFLKVFGFL